ncbi:MAG TPA: GDSL-type esterase/lipase family protein [Tepidisphaeraceae bacterium]|nr:GDSL-type esterase/lipase family protein [Tepidisphaeraceae bacterium]
MTLKMHYLHPCLALLACLLSSGSAAGAANAVKPSDEALRYFGRWSTADVNEYVSQWAGAYVKAAFTGDRVTIKLGDKPSSFYSIIDGGEPQRFEAKTGDVELTAAGGDAAAPHQLKIIAEVGKEFRFRGLDLPAGETLKAADVHDGHVLFIGDSITFGASATNTTLDAWAPASADAAGLEHARVAQGGIGLVSGYDAPAGKTGMEDQFFKLDRFGSPNGGKPYPPEGEQKPSIIVINLGTNDGNKNEKNPVPMDVFQARYVGFLKKLRDRYPDATILALELFNTYAGDKNKAIRAAVSAFQDEAKDTNVHFVSAKGWVNPDPKGGDIKPDWSHPTDQGHAKLTKKMAEVLRQHAAK